MLLVMLPLVAVTKILVVPVWWVVPPVFALLPLPPRFLRVIRQFNEDLLNYGELMKMQAAAGQSTTRACYFKDLLTDLEEGTRVRAVLAFLDEIETLDGMAAPVSEIRRLLGGGTPAPYANVPAEAWTGDRLNQYLAEIDAAIAAPNYERAVGLSD